MTQHLETARLILRKPLLTDAVALVEIINHPDIAKNMLSEDFPFSVAAIEKWIQDEVYPDWESETGYSFMIVNERDDSVMGEISLDVNKSHNRAGVGYWLGVDYWGQGYATEALRRVIQFGFEELTLNRIYAEFFATNAASRHVMEKVGMHFEGILRQNSKKHGTYYDDGVCAILRQDYVENP